MSDVFISYARSTEAQARAAAAALRALGYSVWVDEDLPTHRAYADVIAEQLASAKAVVVIWSAEAVKSQWVRSEANRAREGAKLVQFTIDKTPLPMPFDQIQCADLSGWSGAADHPGWPRIVASVAELVGGQSAPAPAAVGAAPGGERRHVTVLACNIASATQIASHLDPEQWRDVLMRFQRAASHAVTRLDGHMARSAGDGLVVYFGYPQAREDAAERAVRAGLAVIEATADLARPTAGEPGLQVRAAVHTGTVVVAQGEGAEVDMFGDAPRIASGLQALAPPGAVVMSRATHDLVSGLFVIGDLGEQPVGGVDAPMRIYRAIRPGVSGGRGFTQREPTPFVGREEEMQLLASRWERVRDGEGQLVQVTGEPGIGKSRLIDEFQARIRSEPHLWIDCAGAALFANTPFHAVSHMLEQGLGGEGDEAAEARVARLEQALAPAGLKLTEAVPLIAEMLNLPPPAGYPPLQLAPDERRRRLLAALVGWVFSATRAQPLVIVFEDLHWIDPSTLEVIHTLALQGATAPLLLLLTSRPEFRPDWPPRGHHGQIALGRLSNRQTRQLVTGVVARAGLAEDMAERIIARTDGVPLFAEELTRLVLDGQGDARQIPETLHDSLAARLDRMGRAKEVAQLGSVLGREFAYPLLRAVSAAPEAELRADLAKLAEAELIYERGAPPEATYRFKHALTQDAAYEALLKSRRRELHALAARTIVDQFADLAEAQPEVLARHWTAAGEAAPAIAAWRSAGDAAYARRAFKEAEAGYRQALSVLDGEAQSPERDAKELELCSALNRVLQLTRGYAAPETVETAARARALAEKSGSVAHLIREEAKIWQAIITSGDYPGASALADHILDLVTGDADNPGRRLFAHNTQVQTRFYTGDLAGVEEHFALLSPLIDTVGRRQTPGNNIIAIGVAAWAAWSLGHAKIAHQRMARAHVLAEASQDPYDLAMTLHFQGVLHVFERDAQGAEALASELAALAEAHGFAYAGGLAGGVLGWALAQRGAVEEGLAMMARSSESQALSGAGVGRTFGLMRIADAQGLAGETQAALATLEEALTINPDERIFAPGGLRLRGDLHVRLGDAASAEADFRKAMGLARSMGATAWEFRSAIGLARLEGRDAARDLLIPLRAGMADGVCAADLAEAAEVLGETGQPLLSPR
jgi:class 3 adenylate cyclase/tetratricopeptide (TPR) repeat protein